MTAACASVVEHLLAKLDVGEGDVTLVLGRGEGQETVKALSVLLCRAAYFESALKVSYQEGQSRRVELPDVDPKLMMFFVRALYGERFSHMQKQDSSEKLTANELFMLCTLCERFLAPDVVLQHAYESYAACVVSEDVQLKDYIGIFVQLSGKRMPETATKTLIEGFRDALRGKELGLHDFLACVVDAQAKKVSDDIQAILNSEMAARVTLGSNLANAAVCLAKQGAIRAAEAVFDQLKEATFDDTYRTHVEQERMVLLEGEAVLPSHIFHHLKSKFSTNAMPGVILARLRSAKARAMQSANSPFGYSYQLAQMSLSSLDRIITEAALATSIENMLVKDIEEAHTQLFAIAVAAADAERVGST